MIFSLPKLIGHRGVKDLAPENTLYSINKAIQLNLKWIEVDVKISKDHVPFLLHDDKLERTTSGNGNPLEYEYRDIFKLDAGSWFDIKYKNAYPPTLEEVLKHCSQYNIGINMELKSNQGFEKENVIAVSELLKNSKFTCPYYFSSFNWFSVILIKKLLPNSHAGIILDKINTKNNYEKFLYKCKKYNIHSCCFNTKTISKELIEICKNYGMFTTVYSSKNIEKIEADNLWHLGVDSVFIDNPTTYKEILK